MSQMTFKGFTDGSDFRPFACDWESCKKDFKRRSDLTRHYKIHTNERPHPCTAPGCDKRFIQRSALAVHTRTHTGEKPHKCKFPGCIKRFSDSSSLARHRHVHTGSRIRRCAHIDCPKSFCRNKLAVKQKQQSQQRDIFAGQIDCVSDSESSRSSSMPAQPTTPQHLHAMALQGSMFQHTTAASDLDGQMQLCYIDEPFHSPQAGSDDLHDMTSMHRFNSLPLYAIGQGNTHLEAMGLDSQYPGSMGHSPIDPSYPTLGLSNSPSSSPTGLPPSAVSQKGFYKYMGLQNSTYSLKSASSLGQTTPMMSYSQQLAHARQQMLINPGQIPSQTVARYNSPPVTMGKSEPWYGYESYGVYNI
ncbi:hypothetical protein J3F83DRAFT_227813 [Trichoderma novae-zelandiae]